MQLLVRDVARLLNVAESQVFRWIREDDLPAYKVSDQYRFNRAELLEWATARKIHVSVDLFAEPDGAEALLPRLAESLATGGVFYGLEGTDRASALRSVVGVMPLPPGTDRGLLLDVMLAREAMASTAIGDGIAIPHVRNPIVLHVPSPVVSLCFLAQAVDFGAMDGVPVFALFSVISPTVRTHLHLLSRLAFSLRDPALKAAVARRADADAIIGEVRRVEAGLVPPAGPATRKEPR